MTTSERAILARLGRGGMALADGVGRGVAGLFRTLLRWQELERQRRALQEMDERTLKDIGLTRFEARHLAGDIVRRELGRLVSGRD